MDFELTDEQRLLERTVREWGAREVAPRIRGLDRAHRFDKGLLPKLADLGLLGIAVPPAYGGAGLDDIRMEADYQASRLLWLRAGWLKNRGRRNTREIHTLMQADYVLGYREDRPARLELPPILEG